MIRKPTVAGQFYNNDFQELEDQIAEAFHSDFGPGDLHVQKREGKIIAIISAHAGYMFSGPAMAWGFKAVAEANFPDLFIMLGPSHAGYRNCLSTEDWETPFGVVSNDPILCEILKNNGIEENSAAHHEEHSIEVQLPFLQFVSRDKIRQLKIVPIMIGEENINETAERIKKSIDEYGKEVCIITSSDFTHFGPAYDYVPFRGEIKENMKNLDFGAIEHIKKLSAGGFLDYCKKTGATICGKLPIAVMLEVVKGKAKKVLLEQYYTSGDIAGDYGNAVGYASIIIK